MALLYTKDSVIGKLRGRPVEIFCQETICAYELMSMCKIIVGKQISGLKPHPLSPSPFRGGGTRKYALNLKKSDFWRVPD